MKFKINKNLLPIKAHFFFFFAALGPVLPQMNVFGRQLGVSPAVMGMVTAVLPLLWAAAKPLFGYVVDFWPAHRKLVFMLLITLMTGSYCCLWFLPMPEEPGSAAVLQYVYHLNDTVSLQTYNNETLDRSIGKYNCQWNCSTKQFDVYLKNSTFVNTIYVDRDVTNESCSLYGMHYSGAREGQVMCSPITDCNLKCFEDNVLNLELDGGGGGATNRSPREVDASNNVNKMAADTKDGGKIDMSHSDSAFGNETIAAASAGFYTSWTFWLFVVLMCVGTVAFNVANCIGDAVCFDVLGPDHGSKYGAQRAYGTFGYGLAALLGGFLVDLVSGPAIKDFTPAFALALILTAADLYSCRKLKLPSLSSPEDSGKALREVLKIPRVLVFIAFAIIAGAFDSFIIYYMFWLLEELAEETGYMAKIKLIEGVVVASECLIGELLFFFYSGKIIKRLGYGTTLTISLFFYGVRMVAISFMQNPWHLVFIEAITQGPTYALCYSTIVGYAAYVAPEGYSATVQGIVAGMDDGVGFTLGSLVGGYLYTWAGGRVAFRVLGGVAVLSALAHAAFVATVAKHVPEAAKAAERVTEGEKMLNEMTHTNAIYRDTVEPLMASGNTASDETR